MSEIRDYRKQSFGYDTQFDRNACQDMQQRVKSDFIHEEQPGQLLGKYARSSYMRLADDKDIILHAIATGLLDSEERNLIFVGLSLNNEKRCVMVGVGCIYDIIG